MESEKATNRGAIARVLLAEGILEQEQIAYAERIQSKLSTPKPFVEVIQELYSLTPERVSEVLKSRRREIGLGELLVEFGHLRAEDLETALQIQAENPDSKERLGDILVTHRFVDEEKLVAILSVQLGFELADPEHERIDAELRSRVPIKWCVQHEFVPLRNLGDQVAVAFVDPTDPARLGAAEEVFGVGRVAPCIAPRSSVLAALEKLAGTSAAEVSVSNDDEAVTDVVNRLLEAAIEEGVSDIHIEPRKDRLSIRFRQDGVLVHHRDTPLSLAPGISSRIKVLCKADIAERRRHQGGRFFFDTGEQQIDLRVSIYVTVHGEKIVMRLLNHDRKLLSLSDIGMAPRMLERFRDDALERPSGVVMITGPTGSGKTTTLYSAVHEIQNDETSIITAEDPVEYVIDGVSQCSINPSIDLGFEETLKHIVRQDPDVIVIGEIRDAFSAETAIQAALTGHKVLTTFHTEDTIGGLLRLLNMDIEAFLVSSTVVSVIAQRLLRRVCQACAEDYELTPAGVRRLGYSQDALAGGDFKLGRGCPECRYGGYKGRICVFELLVLDTAVRDAILMRQTSHEIRRISRESSGLVSLLEDGVVKAARGQTTVPEIVRMLPRLDKPRPLSTLRRLIGG